MTLHCVDVVLNKCVPPPPRTGSLFILKGDLLQIQSDSRVRWIPAGIFLLIGRPDTLLTIPLSLTLLSPHLPFPLFNFSSSTFHPCFPFTNSSSFYRSYNCFSSFPQYSFQRLLFLSLTLILSTVLLQLKESFHQPFSSHHVTRIFSFSFSLSFYSSPTLLLSALFWFTDSFTSHQHFSTTFVHSTTFLPPQTHLPPPTLLSPSLFWFTDSFTCHHFLLLRHIQHRQASFHQLLFLPPVRFVFFILFSLQQFFSCRYSLILSSILLMLIRSFAFINRFPLTNPSYYNPPFPFYQLIYCSTTLLLPSLRWFNNSVTFHPHFSSTKLLPYVARKHQHFFLLQHFFILQDFFLLLCTRLPPSLLWFTHPFLPISSAVSCLQSFSFHALVFSFILSLTLSPSSTIITLFLVPSTYPPFPTTNLSSSPQPFLFTSTTPPPRQRFILPPSFIRITLQSVPHCPESIRRTVWQRSQRAAGGHIRAPLQGQWFSGYGCQAGTIQPRGGGGGRAQYVITIQQSLKLTMFHVFSFRDHKSMTTVENAFSYIWERCFFFHLKSVFVSKIEKWHFIEATF